MNSKKRIGEMLLEAGIIDETQLKAALGHQRQWGVRLGQALVDLKLATEADIVRALSFKFGFEVAKLDALEPYGHEQALKLFPGDLAVQNNVFPMWADTANLTIAMSDPTNLAIVDEIRFRTGRRVKVCIAGDREIAEALKRQYPGGDGVEAIALDLDADGGGWTAGESAFDPFGGGSSRDALDAFFGGDSGAQPATAGAAQDPRARGPVLPAAPAPAPVRAPAGASRSSAGHGQAPAVAPSSVPAPQPQPAAGPNVAQPRPAAGPNVPQPRPAAGPNVPQPRPAAGPNVAQPRPAAGPNVATATEGRLPAQPSAAARTTAVASATATPGSAWSAAARNGVAAPPPAAARTAASAGVMAPQPAAAGTPPADAKAPGAQAPGATRPAGASSALRAEPPLPASQTGSSSVIAPQAAAKPGAPARPPAAPAGSPAQAAGAPRAAASAAPAQTSAAPRPTATARPFAGQLPGAEPTRAAQGAGRTDRPPIELELESGGAEPSLALDAPDAMPDLHPLDVAPLDFGPESEPILASELAPELTPEEEIVDGSHPWRDLTESEIAILESLERLADGGPAEPEVVKPTQAMAAMIRLLIRKRIMSEQEFLDELSKK